MSVIIQGDGPMTIHEPAAPGAVYDPLTDPAPETAFLFAYNPQTGCWDRLRHHYLAALQRRVEELAETADGALQEQRRLNARLTRRLTAAEARGAEFTVQIGQLQEERRIRERIIDALFRKIERQLAGTTPMLALEHLADRLSSLERDEPTFEIASLEEQLRELSTRLCRLECDHDEA